MYIPSLALLLTPSLATCAVWQPAVGSKFQIILSGTMKLPTTSTTTVPNVPIFDIDLFTTPTNVIATLHKLNKKVICYFSAGSYEPYRPDSSQFKASDLGNVMEGWEDEKWLNTDSSNVRAIMKKRIELAKSKGCDAIDPDNMDGYNNNNGIGLTKAKAINYTKYLANLAAQNGLAMGLKNAPGIISDVLPYVQFSINEECVEYSECSLFTPFINAGKPVFHIEYPSSAPKVTASQLKKYCATSGAGAGATRFSTVLKTWDLDGFVEYCDGTSFKTPITA